MTQELTKRQIAARKAAETRRKTWIRKRWWKERERHINESKEWGLYIPGDFPVYGYDLMDNPFYLPEIPTEVTDKNKEDIYKTLYDLERLLDIPHVSSKKWQEDETVTIHYIDSNLHGHIVNLSSDWNLEQFAEDLEKQGLKPILALKYPSQAFPVFLCWDVAFHPSNYERWGRYRIYGADSMFLPRCSYEPLKDYRELTVSAYTYRPNGKKLYVYFVSKLLIEAHEGVIYPVEAMPHLPELDGIMPWDNDIYKRFYGL